MRTGCEHEVVVPGEVPDLAAWAPAGPAALTVLVVEDDPLVLGVIAAMLERLGYRVLAAGSPDEALRLSTQHPGAIHLLLTDLLMPKMSGPALAARLHRRRPDLPVLYTTGYTDGEVRRAGLLAEEVDLLRKPFSLGEMAARVRAALGRAAAPGGNFAFPRPRTGMTW